MSADFPLNFLRYLRYSGKKLGQLGSEKGEIGIFLKFCLYTLVNFHRKLIFLKFACQPCEFSTGSSSISARSGPKSADFSKFSRLHLSKLAKSLENLTLFFDEIWFLFEIFKVSRGFVAKQETEIA